MISGTRECPGCKSNDRKLAGAKNGFEIFVCLNCRSLYTAHLPITEDAENYDEYYPASNLAVPDFIIKRVKEIVEGFSGYRSTNRLLDIGFGAGTILDVAKTHGWDVCGQEVSAPAVAQAREKGFEVFHGDLRSAGYPDEHFDVVTCSEIIEHLPNPQEVLSEIARMLRPSGLFWATTPSARGLSFRILGTEWSVLSPPEHTQLYSKKGMTVMLRNAGFSEVRLKTFGLNPSEILHFFKSKPTDVDSGVDSFNRVETSYALNEKLSSGPVRKRIKGLLNGTLNMFGLGDSLKIYAKR